ncbi:Uncharacterised protein [Escherichia coli]|nr:Uncharacterised protein [Escherichia coli]
MNDCPRHYTQKKRLIGQFHLFYVKTRFGGFLLLEGQKDE